MVDKDNQRGLIYNTDLLSRELIGIKRDTYYIEYVDEALAWMYANAFEEELKTFVFEGKWKKGKWLLDESIWQETDLYITEVDQLMDMPYIDSCKITDEVDDFIERVML